MYLGGHLLVGVFQGVWLVFNHLGVSHSVSWTHCTDPVRPC
jgi:hypothetical protein